MQDHDFDLVWRQSKACGSSACLQVAESEDAVMVRDSKDQNGPRLSFQLEAWAAFVAEVRAGHFDRNGVGV